ncbi:MAG: DUF1501 domain-containing protein, partial [Planctomycetota bacterium]|nr:DUF1501 domain-containing protein [Planctomycetota bacterium]
SLSVLAELNRNFAGNYPDESSLQARIGTYEMAARMQMSIPDLFDFSSETAATQEMYGMNNPEIAPAAKNFLLARRMIERGVRFVQLFNGASLGGNPRINWDAHEDVYTNHIDQAKFLDQPCAALIKDLKQRGLFDDTLVFWSSEFGRTPFTQGVDTRGRDHHNLCFTAWLAGAGLKPGMGYGLSDEFGYLPAEHPATLYDLHATILHLFGIDHTQLTYYHNGINRRLTDVHGHVLDGVLA